MTTLLYSQELNFTVKINTQKLQVTDQKVFETLERTLLEFLNNQKWTNTVFESEERINCNLILTIQEEYPPSGFKGHLAIQSSRPVFGSDYETPMFNYIDKEVTFEYEQFQPIVYSKNNYNDNLSSALAFYAHIILGMDYDSFSPFGGEEYFQRAQDIVNSVPPSAASANPGWRSVDGNRNRFWLIENILSPRVKSYRQAMYDYHRQGLDLMASDSETGRANMAQALDVMPVVNQSYPNSMILALFSSNKAQEIVEIFKRGTLPEQNQVMRAMVKIDPANASKYRGIK
ncbi:MAG: DUF4835 domain-containing protein [Saprospiraceae bacterium]|nr:MAG: DUF4835 domain-containing protein [Saprospiraceae bacterium]